MIELVIYLLMAIVISSIVCFKGKKLYFPVIMIAVFLSALSVSIRNFGVNNKGIIIGVVIGAVLALLTRSFYKIGFFVLGLIAGAILSGLIITVLPKDIQQYNWIIILISAIVTGMCTLKWSDIFIMLSTASSGASTLALTGSFLITNFANLNQFVKSDEAISNIKYLNDYLKGAFAEKYSSVLFVVTVVLFISGFMSQLKDD